MFFILIERLRYDTRLTGSIVIVCANEDDVKMASGHLTQANIKCSQFDSLFSGNQMSKFSNTRSPINCILVQFEFHISHYFARTGPLD